MQESSLKNVYNISAILDRKNPKISQLQNQFGRPKPVKEYNKISKVKIANSGEDPSEAIIEFRNKDIVKPLSRGKLYQDSIMFSPSDKWALNTEKKCCSPDKLPKVQQYKEYYWDNINLKGSSENLRYISTDHITPKMPHYKVNKSENIQFRHLKSLLNCNTETLDSSWIPKGNFKTINNRNSVVYNIINNEENKISGAMVMKVFDSKISNKKKGITEIVDISKPFYPNFNKEYANIVENQKDVFKKYNGIFSYLYDSAHRNGNLVPPFRSDKNAHKKRIHDNQTSNASKSYTRKIDYSNKIRSSTSNSPQHK